MQEDPTQIKQSPEKLEDLETELRQNKKVMFDILRKSPKVGAYKGQNKEDWSKFYEFFINFLKSQIGPRGQCAKRVRKQLLKDQEQVNKILAPFGLTAHTHIREINMKVKNYVPSPVFILQRKLQQSKDRFVQNIQRFEDPTSPMVKAISDGMIKKHGKDYPVQKQLIVLKENYEKKLKEANIQLAAYQETLNQCEGYHQLIRAEKYFKGNFQQWKHADSEIGKENIKTGQQFQTKVFQKILPYLIARQKKVPDWYYQHQQLQVFTNCSWIPKNIGEIDIAIGYKDQKQNRYFITTLIECKSRLFDLREAHKQVSLQNNGDINKGPTFEELKRNKKQKLEKMRAKQNSNKVKPEKQNKFEELEEAKIQEKGQANVEKKEDNKQEKTEAETEPTIVKKFLSTKHGPAELVPNHHFYIITTLPQNQFLLPIESKMKQGIERYTKNMFVQDIKSQPFYEVLKERFSETLSPLDWIEQYESQFEPNQSNIIVLK